MKDNGSYMGVRVGSGQQHIGNRGGKGGGGGFGGGVGTKNEVKEVCL